ncbi:CaiB/BaiF CoA transferase family protein [Kineosporia babensis]|uniref:CaiB/BaiF CoA transferase family protein n=1 Tax=Kineosporia babensis TaxID=499548 RepID=UPI0022AFA9EB|nr:CaiB/BaiF CoA-transferase family protein [Kineosporia babensis]
MHKQGPLSGIRVLELAAIGPVPHAGLILADLGADVVRIDRPGAPPEQLLRGRRAITLDLRSPTGRATLLELAERADVLLEGLRPGVTERLGLGPDECRARNPRLVYGRMTGWGQDGPRAHQAGHDINYISLTGALHAVGRAGERPVPPLNLAGDFGGGSMFLVVGVLAALLERQDSGQGQVVDAAMVDGSTLLMQMIWAMRASGDWQDERGTNLLDGGAPFYDTYTCADGRHVAVGAIEPQFYAELVKGLGLSDLPDQNDRAGWPILRRRFEEAFARHDRDHWAELFQGTDACVTPVLSMSEALEDEHLTARGTFVEIDGVRQPGPAPRFSRSKPGAPPRPDADTTAVLSDWLQR